MESKKKVLDLPIVTSVRYSRNLIDVAVCELRFPTLLELEKKAPEKLQSKLRKKYPYFEIQEKVEFNKSENTSEHYRYIFRSKSKDWAVTIHCNGISLETTAYTEFSEFYKNLYEVMEESKKLIDSDFFTRVGFRYVNTVPIEDGEIDGWLNPTLIGSSIQKPFGSIAKYISEIRGYTKAGDYTFRHGIKSIEDHEIKEYFLDFDYFSEDVEYDNATSLIQEFNEINFSFFDWCLGPKAKVFLGEGKPKRGNKNG
ncbi:MAG: TIGR04255 family protein [Methylococcales bacterium]|nr:TIGR04255 family protein [Methylococcales bacterium]